MGTIYKNNEVYGSSESFNINFSCEKMSAKNVHDAIIEAYEHSSGGSSGSGSIRFEYINLLESGIYTQTSSSVKYVSYDLTDKISNYNLIKIVGSYYSGDGVEQFTCNYWSPEDLFNYKSTISVDKYWVFNMNIGSTNRRIAYAFEEGDNIDKLLLTRTESMALNSIWGIKLVSNNEYLIIDKLEFDNLSVEEINTMGIIGVRDDYNITYIDGTYYYRSLPLIPVLTSNTGDNGVASCPLSNPLYNGKNSSTISYAWHAFDDSDSTYLEYYGENQSGAWCRYDFNEPVHLKSMTAKLGHCITSNVFDYFLQYLKEGTEDEWITVGEGTHTGDASVVEHKLDDVVVTSAVRFYSTTNKTSDTNIFLYSMQAYGYN